MHFPDPVQHSIPCLSYFNVSQMERTWMNCRLFSKEHRDGVNEFMDFVSENFNGS
jgi:hypothetical protein